MSIIKESGEAEGTLQRQLKWQRANRQLAFKRNTNKPAMSFIGNQT
jgi:hypothetical protein